jgi:hypothetical protein
MNELENILKQKEIELRIKFQKEKIKTSHNIQLNKLVKKELKEIKEEKINILQRINI